MLLMTNCMVSNLKKDAFIERMSSLEAEIRKRQ